MKLRGFFRHACIRGVGHIHEWIYGDIHEWIYGDIHEWIYGDIHEWICRDIHEWMCLMPIYGVSRSLLYRNDGGC